MYFFYFYPLGLDRPVRSQPWLTRLLSLVMVVSFIWFRYFPDLFTFDPWNLIFYPGNGSPWTAVSAIFLHGGWLHLAGNLIYFNVFGPAVEDRLGSAKYLLVFLMMGSFGNLTHGIVSAWGLLGKHGAGVLGASGALAGLLALAMVRFYSARVKVGWWVFAPLAGQNKAGKTYLPLVVAASGWLFLQIVHTALAHETGSAVSYGAHLGGFSIGLFLAMVLGQLQAGRVETRLEKAKAYFREGEFFAAVGAWSEFLELAPENQEGHLGRARALRLVGQPVRARSDYQWVLRKLIQDREIDEALELYREVHRAGMSQDLATDLSQRLAGLMEKQMDYEGALGAYREIYEAYPETTAGQRALVRLVQLYHGKLQDPEKGEYWLEVACRKLPGGSWREYLASEFSGAKGLGATEGAGSPALPR